MKKFLYTKEEDLAKELVARGYSLICKTDTYWVFENAVSDNKRAFSTQDFSAYKNKVFFSNTLTFSGVF